MNQPLAPWRSRAQAPLVVLALAGIAVAGYLIASKLAEPSESERVRGRLRRPSPPIGEEFDLSGLTITSDAILRGGPPKDGIPALTAPATMPAADAVFLEPGDPIIGVVAGGEARAYPLAILDSHEIANDTLGGVPVAVTYCPLCDSSAVFDRRVEGRAIELGVSGLLYNSNVLMYERGEPGAEGLWSQLAGRGVSGAGAGKPLPRLPMEVCRWDAWRERHPQTTVLSPQTGYERPYDRSVYAGYFQDDRLLFPAAPRDDRLPNKTPVLGVLVGGEARAYHAAASDPSEAMRGERLGGAEFDVVADRGLLRVENADPGVETFTSFWFAWAAFYPEAGLVSLAEPDDPSRD